MNSLATRAKWWERQARRIARRKVKGGCIGCSRPAAPGHMSCGRCLKRRREYSRAHWAKLHPKSCRICGLPMNRKKYPRVWYHPDCWETTGRERVREYHRQYWEAYMRVPAHKERHRKRSLAWQRQKRKEGRCICCGKSSDHGVFCRSCADRREKKRLLRIRAGSLDGGEKL